MILDHVDRMWLENCSQKISLLLIERVLEQGMNVGSHSGCGLLSATVFCHTLLPSSASPTVILDMAETVFQKDHRDSFGMDLRLLRARLVRELGGVYVCSELT